MPLRRNPRLSGWNLQNDDAWKERMKEMHESRPELTGPVIAQPPQDNLKLPTYWCDPTCPICKGETFYIDHHENAIACPNARKVAGGD